MRHEMLTQRALFCHRANTKRGTLSQHFVTHVVPPLVPDPLLREGVARETSPRPRARERPQPSARELF